MTTTTQLALFDYDAVEPDIRYRLQQRAIRINAREEQIVQNIIDNGREFAESRDELRHNKAGGFRGWIEHHGWSHGTAYRYIRVYEEFGNCPTVGQLTPKVLYLLAETNTPEEAREEILGMVDAGETVTPSQAQKVIDQIREQVKNGSVREMTAAVIIDEIKQRPGEPMQVVQEAIDVLNRLSPRQIIVPQTAENADLIGDGVDDVWDPPMEPAQALDLHLTPPRFNEGMRSSETPEWYTPKHIIDLVIEVFGEIDLDPCSNSHYAPNVPAEEHYTIDDDGLAKPWRGKVYMNPPYGDEIPQWIDRLIQAKESDEIDEAIALVPGRTDTNWFYPLRNYALCFIHGRLRFVGAENSAPFPSVIVYMGQHVDRFKDVFSDIGFCMRLL